MVSVFPEFQPMSHKFDSSFKFVGCCVSEKIRKNGTISDPNLKELLDSFEAINPVESINSSKLMERKSKLVYASLGTVFNNNLFIFDIIIDSIRILNRNATNLNETKVLISVGKEGYVKYQNRIRNENFELPQNVILMPKVPQIDVLERASLFITHCGMNSMSEAIHYGVPVICLPIIGDQPLIAYRAVEELKLGRRFNPLELKAEVLKNAIQDVLINNSYLDRMLSFSETSRKYNANSTSANLVVEFLKKSEKKSN